MGVSHLIPTLPSESNDEITIIDIPELISSDLIIHEERIIEEMIEEIPKVSI